MAAAPSSRNRPRPASPVRAALATARGPLIAVAFFSFIINALMLTGPLFMLQVYDRVLASGSVPTLVTLTGLVIGLYALYGVLDLIRSRVLIRIGHVVDEQLGPRAFLAHALGPVRVGPKGENLYPLRELDTLRTFMSGAGPSAIFDLPWLPVYLGLVFLFHPLLGLTATAGALVICAIAAANEVVSRTRSKAAQKSAAKRHLLADAARRNAEVVRALGMEERLAARFRATNDAFLDATDRIGDTVQGFGSATKAFRLLLQSLMLACGAWLAIRGTITPGVMIAASIISARALSPIEQAVGHWRGFIASREAAQRLTTALAFDEQDEARTKLPAPRQRLDVDGIVAGAPGGDKPLLAGIRFQVQAGTIVGVIGSSGAGKSSLSRVLVGVWPAAQGAVRLDGAALDQYGRDDLGRYIGYLPQDVELFGGTVAENIARFEPDADPDAIVAAAKAAGVHDLVTKLPEGYDTQIGEAGGTLSAGQRQRVGLARALYHDPFLVVLDEPNSSLDKDGEEQMVRALVAVRERGGIVILIAHRLAARDIMDQLLVIEAGRMRAFGPREQVMAQISSGTPGLRVVKPGQQG